MLNLFKKYIISAVTIKHVLGGWENMLNQTAVVEEAINSFRATTRSSNLNVLTNSMLQINGYGCWCYFDKDKIHHGKGEAVDEIDQICRYLLEGYQCNAFDSFHEGDEDCVPWEIDYNAGVTLGSFYLGADPSQLLVEACKEKNPNNNCAQRTCIVEGYLVLNIVDAFFNNVRPISDHRHSNGFDVNTCKPAKDNTPDFPPPNTPEPPNGRSGNNNNNNQDQTEPGDGKNIWGDDDMQCCGQYPIRAPYKPGHNQRGCCGDKTYNMQLFDCCENFGSYEIKYAC